MGKLCKYNCGNQIEWSVKDGFYANPDGSKHDCRDQKKSTPPLAPKSTKTDSYYSGIRKVAELTLEEANKQLEDKRWEILKISEKQSVSMQPASSGVIPITATALIYILGMRE